MPFITPPSDYRILGSNITGGAPNLIVNEGVNNLALGNTVLTENTTGNNNVAVGNGALQNNESGENAIAIGVNAGGSLNIGFDNVLLGNNVAYDIRTFNVAYENNVLIGSETGKIFDAEALQDTIVIGHNSLNGNPLSSTAVWNNNIVVGNNNLNVENTQLALNVLIGNNFNNINLDGGLGGKIAIGFNIDLDESAGNEIIIGNPSLTYDTILIGGVDVLNGGGGGFAAQAVQNDDTEVSITSVAGNGLSNFASSYELSATTDNATTSNASFQFLLDGETDVSSQLGFSASATSSSDASLSFQSNTENDSAQIVLSTQAIEGSVGRVSLELSGSIDANLTINAPIFTLTAPSETGTETPSFVATNAPIAGLEITNYISVTLNGVVGYIPFLSVP